MDFVSFGQFIQSVHSSFGWTRDRTTGGRAFFGQQQTNAGPARDAVSYTRKRITYCGQAAAPIEAAGKHTEVERQNSFANETGIEIVVATVKPLVGWVVSAGPGQGPFETTSSLRKGIRQFTGKLRYHSNIHTCSIVLTLAGNMADLLQPRSRQRRRRNAGDSPPRTHQHPQRRVAPATTAPVHSVRLDQADLRADWQNCDDVL